MTSVFTCTVCREEVDQLLLITESNFYVAELFYVDLSYALGEVGSQVLDELLDAEILLDFWDGVSLLFWDFL